MDAKIRFIVRAPSNQTVFTHMEQVDQPIIAAKIRERYGALELKMKQEARVISCQISWELNIRVITR
ncbi:hypothetical protein MHH52_23790 [Paenibacillus sp. FSL K6-0276]|uniref:hypothetical protein n=1 Tax=unclassified Paenibacillus TaxID=185978 RepID=UPI0028B1C5FA|nr:hypothetical protein [Paenibacillus sp.]